MNPSRNCPEPLPDDQFGEGIAAIDDRLVQLTWKSGIGHVRDRSTLIETSTFRYDGEGWGLALAGDRLVMSDGTPTLRWLDPTTFAETGHLDVHDGTLPVANLNELEYIDGQIWANVWRTPDIAVIDPISGLVVRWIDVSALRPPSTTSDGEAVANGIAYDPVNDRVYITGKRWPVMYEIRRPG